MSLENVNTVKGVREGKRVARAGSNVIRSGKKVNKKALEREIQFPFVTRLFATANFPNPRLVCVSARTKIKAPAFMMLYSSIIRIVSLTIQSKKATNNPK
jgi:hypothetical protein